MVKGQFVASPVTKWLDPVKMVVKAPEGVIGTL